MCEAVSKALTPTLSESLIAISAVRWTERKQRFLGNLCFLEKRCDTQDTAHITRATGASVPSFSPDEL